MKSASVLASIALSSPGFAAGVDGRFVDDIRGDLIGDQRLTAELGDSMLFDLATSIQYHTHHAYTYVGVPDDGVVNDWTLHLKNVSGVAWTDLFLVADVGATIGNADGRVEDVLHAPGLFTDAFRVDATGFNPNLLWESVSADGILSPGEEWEFAVTNFGTGFNSLPPSLITPDAFAGSSTMASFGGTNASLLATPIPEPAAVAVIAMSAVAMLGRRRRPITQTRASDAARTELAGS